LLPFEFAAAGDKPIDLPIGDAPDDILAHAIAPIDGKLGVQIEADAAAGNFSNQFRRIST